MALNPRDFDKIDLGFAALGVDDFEDTDPADPVDDGNDMYGDDDYPRRARNPREKGDDDGVEYGDPRDEMEDRLLGW